MFSFSSPYELTGTERDLALKTAQFNALVPKRAVRVERTVTGDVRYLHPTKGWRRIARKRFRGADALLPD